MWFEINKIKEIFFKRTADVRTRDVRTMKKRKALKYLINKYETNSAYTKHYLSHILRDHKNNPQFDLYIESELGSLKRSRAFMKSLCQEMRTDNLFMGKKCLDIGCSSGNSLIAFVENGASHATGIEICEHRFNTALINIGGCSRYVKRKISLLRADIQTMETMGIGRFDIIFCNDVLEHVENPMLLVRGICNLMKKTPDALAYINLRNYQHPENIIHEPHYDIPGMVLLPQKIAQEYFDFCRKDDTVKYEVYQWLSFRDYQNMFKSCGKRCDIYGSINPEMAGIHHIEVESNRILSEFGEFSARINLDPHLEKEIDKYINEYLSKMQRLANACREEEGIKELEKFYLDYVIYDINMIITSE